MAIVPNVAHAEVGLEMRKKDEDVVDEERFTRNKNCNDVLFALLFLVQFGGLIAIVAHYGEQIKVLERDLGSAEIWGHFYEMLGFSVGFGILIAFIMLTVVTVMAKFFIWLSFIVTLALLLTGLIVCFAEDQIGGGVAFSVFFVLEVLYIYFIRSRIKFATTMLKIVAGIVKKYKMTVLIAVLGMAVLLGYTILWLHGAAYIVQVLSNKKYENMDGFLIVFILFAMYWTSQVIQNCVHTTTAGTVGTWYFMYPGNMPSWPVIRSLKRAVWNSFGSICLGSLLVAIIQSIRSLVAWFVQKLDSKCIKCCLMCLLNCVTWLVQFFNEYALSQVAIYGKSYCRAASDTWSLMSKRGFDFLINDDLVGSVLNFGALVGGIGNLAISLLVTKYFYEDMNTADISLWAFVAFFIGYLLCVCAMSVVSSGVLTFFVCFAEDPKALADSKLGTYETLSDAWNSRYGEEHPLPKE